MKYQRYATSAVLTCMRDLLSEPARWTRRSLARSMIGKTVAPLSELACCWSLSGALARSLYELMGPYASEVDWHAAYDAAELALWHALPEDHPRTYRRGHDVDGFNDYPATSHADILQLLDAASSNAALAVPH